MRFTQEDNKRCIKQNKALMAGCRGCSHLQTIEGGSYWICNYAEETGHLRPCPIENCTVKDLRPVRSRRRTFHINTAVLFIITAVLMALTLYLCPETSATSVEEPAVVSERDPDAECLEARQLALKRRMTGVPPVRPHVAEQRIFLGRYYITGYDICVSCCGKTDGITASGVQATVGRTCAAPKSFDFGDRIWIEGLGERVVEDRGGAIKGSKIDVLCEDHPQCYAITGWYDVYKIVEVAG